MFYYILNPLEIGKTKEFKNSVVFKFPNKNSRSKKIKKINDIDLYYNLEEFNEEHKLNAISVKNLNPKSYYMVEFLEQILVTNFLFKKYDVIITSKYDIEDFDKEKIKFFKYIIIEKNIKNKKYYIKYDRNYKQIKD